MEKAPERLQDRYWAPDRLGGALRVEEHYDGRRMLCFTQRPETLPAMFVSVLRRFPTRPAIVVDDRRLTYAELDQIVAAIAGGLAAEGIAAGDRVALFLGNCWEFLALVLACNRLGAIVVPIGTRQRRAELEFLLNDCAAKALVFDAALAGAVPSRDALREPTQLFAAHGDAAGTQRFSDL